MTKIISFITSVVMIVFMAVLFPVKAEALQSGEFTYEIYDGTVTITGYTGNGGAVAIPSVIDGFSVTRIGGQAFAEKHKITSVVIPAGITSIGDWAFYDCWSLTSINIPSSITKISDCVFYGCSSLTSINIPSSITSIGKTAFYGCFSITSFDIPNNVTRIVSDAFNGTKWYNNQPDGVLYLDNWCIGYKGEMPENTSINIKDGINGIADLAFSYCSNLDSIIIPSSITSIGCDAFDSTDWLNNQPDGVLYLDNWCIGYKGEMPENTSINIKDGINGIADNAFFGCGNLASISIPEGITRIADNTFSNCVNLSSINIPDGVTSIGNWAFYSCCNSLTSINIPDSVISIGEYAFKDCYRLTDINIPNSVTTIGDSAFYYCSSLTDINIPNNVISIGYGVFMGCYRLTEINVNSDNSYYCSIDGVLFDFNKKTIIAYPNGKANSSYTVPNGVTSIGIYAFFGCDSLISVNIPDSVIIIGYHAFSACSNLTNVNMPDSVVSIGSGSFAWCSSLTNINIPNSVISIEGDPFYNSGWYDNQPDGVLYLDNWCIGYKGEMPENTSINIGGGIKYIIPDAFYGYKNLVSINIPDSVVNISNWSFGWCESLTSISIPESVTSIGHHAFWGCSSLASINIPESITYIGDNAFGKCYNITIYGYKGSYAETYANENAIPFVALDGNEITVSSPTNLTLSKIDTNLIKVSWTEASEVDGYEVWYSTSKDSTYNKICTTTGNSFTHTGLTIGQTYYYKVHSYKTVNGKKYYSEYTSIKSLTLPIPKPSNIKLTNIGVILNLSWVEVNNVSGYEIYRSTSKNGTYKMVSTTSITYYNDQALTNGKTYYYKIRAYKKVGGSNAYSDFSNIVEKKATLSKPTSFKAKRKNSNSIKLTWEKVTGATGYRIYRSTSKKGKYKIITTVSSKKTSYINKSLKKGTTYYYKIRAIQKTSKKTYESSYSVIKKGC